MIPESYKFYKDTQPLRDRLQFVYFWDFAKAYLKDPLVGEQRNKSLVGTGAGLRLGLWDNFYLRFDWGFPVTSKPSDDSDSQVYVWAHLDLL
jgi:hemolysin activation/secretion protein